MKQTSRLCTAAYLSLALLAGCGGHEESSSASAATSPTATPAQAGTETTASPTQASTETTTLVAHAGTPGNPSPASEAASGNESTAASDQQNELTLDTEQQTFMDDGSSENNHAAASAADTPTDAAAQSMSRSAMRALAATTTVTTVVGTNFEAAFTGFSPGWWLNHWGRSAPSYEAARATGAGLTYAGTGSQRFKLNAAPVGGAAHMVYTYKFVNGANYTATLYLRAERAAQVNVQLRRDASNYEALAQQTVALGTGWTKVQLSGTWKWADMGSLRIVPITLGANIYVDEMSIVQNTTTTTTTPTTPTTPTNPTPTTGGLTLQAGGVNTSQVVALRNSSMDEAYASTAPGWWVNSWGGNRPAYSVGRETRAGYVAGGAASQRFQIINKNGGEVQLAYNYPFALGKTYRVTMRVRSDVAVPVKVFMRRDAYPWDAFASRNFTATSAWQTVDVEGTHMGSETGSLRVTLGNASGQIWIDDVTLSEVVVNRMAPFTTNPIPDTLFGMHINKLGLHYQWPGLGTRIVRLWNTGTTWKDLEPSQNAWNWASGAGYRMDMYVKHILTKAPGTSIIYTLGMTPQWASSTPGVAGLYGYGTTGTPRDMNDWRDYVRTLARRYVGKIRYWELWNEPDYVGHWNGNMAILADMGRIAREELLAADPNNRLISPGMTVGEGIRGLQNFLGAGGGNHVDIIGFHWYYGAQPEGIGMSMDNVRRVMGYYGVQAKPLWNTEGAFACNPAITNCATSHPTVAESRSANARALLMMATKGIGNFSYHVWEGIDNHSKLIQGDFVTPTAATGPYGEAVNWLRGARVIDGFYQNNQVYMVKLDRAGEIAYVLWAPAGSLTVNLPSSWAVNRIRTLSATESGIAGTRQVTVGVEPIMLRP